MEGKQRQEEQPAGADEHVVLRREAGGIAKAMALRF